MRTRATSLKIRLAISILALIAALSLTACTAIQPSHEARQLAATSAETASIATSPPATREPEPPVSTPGPLEEPAIERVMEDTADFEPPVSMVEIENHPAHEPDETGTADAEPSLAEPDNVTGDDEQLRDSESAGLDEAGAQMETSLLPVVEVEVQLFAYRPEWIEVPVGTTVTWTNFDDIGHSITSGTPDSPDSPAGLFDSGLFGLNESFSYTFTQPGEYSYFCTRHPHMVGTIFVLPN